MTTHVHGGPPAHPAPGPPRAATTTPPLSETEVCVVGAGYVGLATVAILAERGCRLRVAESAPARLRALARGEAPILEPGIGPIVAAAVRERRLLPHAGVPAAAAGADLVVIAVGTPPGRNGRADLAELRTAVAEAAAQANPGAIIVIKSTVPPGTTRQLQALPICGQRRIRVVSCPEFLREGMALEDLRHPARVIVGGDDADACERVAALFGVDGVPSIITDSIGAELIKYTSNAFLALKISFINEVAHLCELLGADVLTVADGVGSDPRIGRDFLDAGLGFGGSCLPKDLRALENISGHHGHSFAMLRAALEVNLQQKRRVAARIEAILGGTLIGRRVAVLGLAFKPGTDDVRDSPSLDLIDHLADLGAEVVATDPCAGAAARAAGVRAELRSDPYDCVSGADAAVVATGWAIYADLDWARAGALMARRVIVDARNRLDPEHLRGLGFDYVGIGRPGPAG